MLKRFLPSQHNFFDLFQKSADIVTTTTIQFHAMLTNLPDQQKYVDRIATYKHEGDKVAHATFKLLHKTFITPFDRYDTHQLTSGLNDILVDINHCSQRFPFYHLTAVPTEMITLAQLCVQTSMLLKEAIYRIHSLKKSDDIINFCDSINHIEGEAQRIILLGEKDLFDHEDDFKHFFKLNEIYARLKYVISSHQRVATIVKGIVLEYS